MFFLNSPFPKGSTRVGEGEGFKIPPASEGSAPFNKGRKGRRKAFLSLFFLGVMFPALLFAYQNPGISQGFVNDFAGLLSAEQRQALEAKLTAFENNTRNEIAVVTVKNLGEDTVENYAEELFQEWGIGKKGEDNGILVLVAAEDRKMRIEVGYGLEGALTDAQASWIIRNVMTPAFRANDYYGGIDGAVSKILAAVGGETIPSDEVSSGQSQSEGFNFSDIFFIILFVPIWLASILGRSKSWWAGGVVGGLAGVVVGFIFGFFYFGIAAVAVLIPIGLLFDFFVSRAYGKSVGSGMRPPWWIGGGRGGGGMGSGFGGFGGGGSGGGGSSGSW